MNLDEQYIRKVCMEPTWMQPSHVIYNQYADPVNKNLKFLTFIINLLHKETITSTRYNKKVIDTCKEVVIKILQSDYNRKLIYTKEEITKIKGFEHIIDIWKCIHHNPKL